jgi:hypothetical protein
MVLVNETSHLEKSYLKGGIIFLVSMRNEARRKRKDVRSEKLKVQNEKKRITKRPKHGAQNPLVLRSLSEGGELIH